MSLTASECLRRGFKNLSANWELVLLQWFQSLLVLALLLLGLAAPLLTVGLDVLQRRRPDFEELLLRLSDLSPPLMLGLGAMLAVWTLSFFLHCWFQAGTYGILLTADRQALPGRPRDRRLFRTFSLRDFSGWAGRYVWRFFWFVNLFSLLGSLVLLAAVLWLALVLTGGERWGGAAALGIGCGGALPLGFLILVLSFWYSVAQADLAREGSGVWTASRTGLSVLGRRLGAVLLLFLIFLIAVIGLAVVLLPVTLTADVLLSDAPDVLATARVVLFLLQGIPNALLTVALGGALVALVRSELRNEARRKPEVQTA
jgi:hypothetical protein